MAKDKTLKTSSTLAKSDDGTIQITFDIPGSLVEKTKKEAVLDLAKDVEVEGFRKGKAPIERVADKIPQATLIEKTLSKILPGAFSDAITQYKLKPSMYPRFELLSAKEGEDWQVRAVTCELPEIVLGDYKNVVSGAMRAKSITKELTKEEKEQIAIKTLLETIKINIPKVLIEEEVNARLSSLLERIEKLGLSLDTYLSSIGKTPEGIRGEYELAAKDALALELILNKIADSDGLKVEEKEIDGAIAASGADPKVAERLNTPEQRRLIRSVLLRKAALDSLTSLV